MLLALNEDAFARVISLNLLARQYYISILRKGFGMPGGQNTNLHERRTFWIFKVTGRSDIGRARSWHYIP